jgi:hypothetical protein
MALTQTQLANALDSNPASVSIWKSRGMPVDSVDAAKAWVAANVRRNKGARISGLVASENLAMGARPRLDRAAEGEIRHYELWKAAANSQDMNSRAVAELAGAWRDSRKAAAQAEQELAAFLAMKNATLNKQETVAAIRSLVSALRQDFSTFPWGRQATELMKKQLGTLPSSLSEATATV